MYKTFNGNKSKKRISSKCVMGIHSPSTLKLIECDNTCECRSRCNPAVRGFIKGMESNPYTK